jgi:hypothetical protein
VERLLTIDQKPQRVDDSEQCLAIFNRNKDEFFRGYITMDVTWLLQNTPESNRQSVSVLWDARGIIFIFYLEKGQTIHSEYYMGLLER